MTTRINNHSSPLRNIESASSNHGSTKVKVGCFMALILFLFGWLFASSKKTTEDLRKQTNRDSPASASSTTAKTSRVATGRQTNPNDIVAQRSSPKAASQQGSPAKSNASTNATSKSAKTSTAPKQGSATSTSNASPNRSPESSPKAASQQGSPNKSNASTNATPKPTQPATAAKQGSAPNVSQKAINTELAEFEAKIKALVAKCKSNLNRDSITELYNAINQPNFKAGSHDTSRNIIIQSATAEYLSLLDAFTLAEKQKGEQNAIIQALVVKCKGNLNREGIIKLYNAIKLLETKTGSSDNSWNNIVQAAWSEYRSLHAEYTLAEKMKQLAELKEIVDDLKLNGRTTPENIAKGIELIKALKNLGKESFSQVQRDKINECNATLKTVIQKQYAEVNAIVDGIDDEDGATPEKITRGLALTAALKKYASALSKAEMENVIRFELLLNAKMAQGLNKESILKGDYSNTLKAVKKYLKDEAVLEGIKNYAKEKPDYAKAVEQIRSAKETDPSTLFAGDLKQKKMQLSLHPDRNRDRQEEATKLFNLVNAAVQVLSN
jgi:hypothetical protein